MPSLALALLAAAATPAPGTAIAPLLAGTAGQWCGRLEYRDYQSDRWEGLPMATAITAQPDGVTMVRLSAFDDGPKVGLVWITGLEQFDPASGKLSYASARKGKAFATGSQQLDPGALTDATHWQLIASEREIDGNAPALIRQTITRDGDRLTTLKEVADPAAATPAWKPRNRTVLMRYAGAADQWPRACFTK
ncbi:MAG: hypothetical protein JSS36_12120 [Proteobacteria bacterium]|nr:hypothetical protein [Pseudomonadota bacterium]